MLRTAGICIVVCFFSLSLWSQSDTVSGTVRDASNALLPRATVRILTWGGNEFSRSLTDSHGRFRFAGLGEGSYTIEASLTGFQTVAIIARPGEDIELLLPLAPVRESVVVSATRTDVPTGQIGAAVTVIAKDEIVNRQELLVSELLQSVPGLTVVRSGGLGNITSLFVRGGEGDYNKVLLDGIPLNEPGGTFQFDSLSTENLERIEVVRGPQSALFGSDAMSSVVQLFTQRGSSETPRPHTFVSVEGGKYATWRGRAGVSGELGIFDYATSFARLNTANQEPNNEFRSSNASGNFGVSPNASTEFRLILRGTSSRAGTPGQTAFGRPDGGAFFRRADGYAGLSLRNQTTSRWEQRALYTYARSRQVSRDTVIDPPYTPGFEGRSAPFQFSDFLSDFLNDTRRQHVSYQSDISIGSFGRIVGSHLLTFAFDWDHEQGFLQDRQSGSLATDAKRNNFGWVFQHQAIWERLVVTNGVRIEDNDGFGSAVVPRSSMALFLRTGQDALGATKLKFNFGLGIKEPTLVESFSPSPSFPGNPELRPERVRSIDFGVEQRLWQDTAKLELNWFDNTYRDLVSFLITGFNPTRGSYFNIQRNKVSGAEVVLELNPVRALRTRATYTFLDSEIVRSPSPSNPAGQSLIRRPRHSGSLLVTWQWQRMNVTSSAVFVGARTDSDFSSLQPPLTSNDGSSKWDLAWMYRLPQGLTVFGVFENILNQHYMEALGFPALRFTYRSGVRLEF